MNAALEDPAVWNDPKRAQELGKEKKALEGVVLVIAQLDSDIADNTELYEMSKGDNDIDSLTHIEARSGQDRGHRGATGISAHV